MIKKKGSFKDAEYLQVIIQWASFGSIYVSKHILFFLLLTLICVNELHQLYNFEQSHWPDLFP